MSDFIHTKVEPSRLSVTASNIEDSLSILENVFRAVDEALNGMLKPTWSGDTCTKFYTQYDKDKQTFVSHTKSIRDINYQLREASVIFDKADNRALDIVQSLNV